MGMSERNLGFEEKIMDLWSFNGIQFTSDLLFCPSVGWFILTRAVPQVVN